MSWPPHADHASNSEQLRRQLRAGEFTGVPLAAVLERAGLGAKAAHVRVEGWDCGVPASASPGTKPFFYDKGLPLEKALHPDTILAWAMNGELLEHLHGAPVRLVVPGWSGNWSVKWARRIEVLEQNLQRRLASDACPASEPRGRSRLCWRRAPCRPTPGRETASTTAGLELDIQCARPTDCGSPTIPMF